ncbi:MAG: hypothetical protein ACUVUB_06890 [Candidatus Bathyarchaeia archaeon]
MGAVQGVMALAQAEASWCYKRWDHRSAESYPIYQRSRKRLHGFTDP